MFMVGKELANIELTILNQATKLCTVCSLSFSVTLLVRYAVSPQLGSHSIIIPTSLLVKTALYY